MEHTNESREEELVPSIVGLDNLDLSPRSTGAIVPAMARQERLEASIVVDGPVVSLDTSICR
jgi:hypothetical protein